MICDYGCGKKAEFKFLNKNCCSNHFSKCVGYKEKQKNNLERKKSYKTRKIQSIKLKEKDSWLCDYGCGNKANYFFF